MSSIPLRFPASRLTLRSLFMLLVLAGCGGDSSVGPSASLVVNVTTQGGVVDADGYTIQVGGSGYTSLAANGSVTINGIQTGSQMVMLGGIAPNCSVTGDNPRTVQIQSGQSATVTFEVVCTALPGGSYRIALMTNSDPQATRALWEISILNSDGSVVPLTTNTTFDGYPSWSPDGQKIAFSSDRDGNTEIYVMNADGSNVIRLTNTPATERFPSWSPDGSKILFESNRDGDTEIFTMNPDGSNVAQLTNNTTGDNYPTFSADGSKILFNSNRDAPETLAPFGKWEIYEMNADGTAPRRVTNDGAIAELPTYFQNGTKIVFDSNRGGGTDIYVMNVDGSAITRLTNNGATNFLAVGSPDQSHIMFTSQTSTNAEVYVMLADGTGVQALTHSSKGASSIGTSYRK